LSNRLAAGKVAPGGTWMRGAVFNGAGKPITIDELTDAPLAAGEVRISVGRCGICGSDVSMTSGSPFDYVTGMRMGHETAGTVIECGPAVSSLKVGDRISVLPRGFCGKCPPCREGRTTFCETGPILFGGFGERLVVNETSGFRIPDSVSMAEGALVEPIACGRRAMHMARMQKGDTVLVMGAGSMGMAAIYWARQFGAGKIVVATRTKARHETALAIGADAVVSLNDEPDAIARIFPKGPDIVVETAGKPGTLHAATEYVRMGGSVISLGMCVAADPILPAFNGFREVSMFFPVAYSPQDYVETLRAFDADRVKPGVIVTETLPLSRLPALIEELRGPHNHHKVQIVPD
jgi:(R,R)-butanediol dehydrogenase/meso-butanediol dehydrogenase/diacetyl reductase